MAGYELAVLAGIVLVLVLVLVVTGVARVLRHGWCG